MPRSQRDQTVIPVKLNSSRHEVTTWEMCMACPKTGQRSHGGALGPGHDLPFLVVATSSVTKWPEVPNRSLLGLKQTCRGRNAAVLITSTARPLPSIDMLLKYSLTGSL